MTQQILKLHLHQLIKANEITFTQLARATSILKPSLHHLLTGKTKKPRPDVLIKLAQFFKLTPNQLTDELPWPNAPLPLEQKKQDGSTVPLISWDSF